ncbi:hypothetical protein D3C73_401860 [compost metagenome]
MSLLLDGNCAKRLGRTIDPGGIQWVFGKKHQRSANLLQRLLKPLHLLAAMQPGIDTETKTLLSMRAEPEMRRLIDEITGGEHAAIDLFGNLRHITAVDKNNCFFLRDKRHARRTGKSGKPGQPLGGFRNILALVFVSARHEKTINTEIREASAKRLDTLATILGRGFIVERLKHGCHSNAAIPLNIHVKAC